MSRSKLKAKILRRYVKTMMTMTKGQDFLLNQDFLKNVKACFETKFDQFQARFTRKYSTEF